MERRLRKQVERFLAGWDHGDRGDAAHLVRARLVATLSEGLETEGAGKAGDERRFHDLGLMAAYLDGQLAGSERHAFEASLMDAPGRQAELDSVLRLVSAVESEQQEPPAELLARAQSAFAIPPAVDTQTRSGNDSRFTNRSCASWRLSGGGQTGGPRRREGPRGVRAGI